MYHLNFDLEKTERSEGTQAALQLTPLNYLSSSFSSET